MNTTPLPTQVHHSTFWKAREEIAGALAGILLPSLAMGESPQDWKVADLVPLLKKGCKNKPGNCLPLSLTPGVGNLQEWILTDKICHILERRRNDSGYSAWL